MHQEIGEDVFGGDHGSLVVVDVAVDRETYPSAVASSGPAYIPNLIGNSDLNVLASHNL